jgi:uncharacterized phage infection (PIP) family protein YhgE
MPTDLFGPYRLNEDHVARIRKTFKDANGALEKLIETLKQLQQGFAQAHLAELELQIQDLIDQTIAIDAAVSKAVAQAKCGDVVVC